MSSGTLGRSDAQELLVDSNLIPRGFLYIAHSSIDIVIEFLLFHLFHGPPIMDNEKLVAICRHELRLEEDHDIARLIQEIKRLQDDSSDTYARLTKKHRVNAREILSGYMLAWEYVEDLDGSRLWSRELCPDALLWPKDKKKYCMMASFQGNKLTHARILAGVEKLFNEFQNYWIIDRQKRKSWPTPKNHKEAVGHMSVTKLCVSNT